MRELLKRFRSFRLVTIVEGSLAALGVIAALLLLILYQTNSTAEIDGVETVVVGFHNQPIPSMFFFLSGIMSIIFGVVVAYTSYPFILAKEKREPNKLIPWFAVAQAAFSLIEIILAFVMISFPGSRHSGLVVVVSIFLLLSAAVQLLMIYPTLRVRIRKEE